MEAEAKKRGIEPFELAVERSDIILVAEAQTTFKTTTRTKGEEEFLFKVVTEFDVIDRLKGDSPNKVTISNGDKCGCKYDFEPGVTYVVLASNHDGKFMTYQCKYIKPSNSGYNDLIIEAIKLNRARNPTP